MDSSISQNEKTNYNEYEKLQLKGEPANLADLGRAPIRLFPNGQVEILLQVWTVKQLDQVLKIYRCRQMRG